MMNNQIELIALKKWLFTHVLTVNASQKIVEDLLNDINQSGEEPLDALLNSSVGVKRTFGEARLETLIHVQQGQDEENNNEAYCLTEQFIHYFSNYTLTEIIRLLLILKALEQTSSVKLLIKNYYQYSDESEKIALLKAYYFIDLEGEASATAIKACRCNSLTEFSAIALNNHYPALFFPELNFNQLVLKSLFMGLNIDVIKGLSTRLNRALSNMCFAYAVEQALAHRNLPATVWLAINADELDEENQALLPQYLRHYAQLDTQHQQQIKTLIKQQSLTFLL